MQTLIATSVHYYRYAPLGGKAMVKILFVQEKKQDDSDCLKFC